MGTLVFICPATGDEVSTGIGMKVETFESLKAETVRCPHCLQVHRLAEDSSLAWAFEGWRVAPVKAA